MSARLDHAFTCPADLPPRYIGEDLSEHDLDFLYESVCLGEHGGRHGWWHDKPHQILNRLLMRLTRAEHPDAKFRACPEGRRDGLPAHLPRREAELTKADAPEHLKPAVECGEELHRQIACSQADLTSARSALVSVQDALLTACAVITESLGKPS